MSGAEPFEAPPADKAAEDAFLVDLDVFEGPLDLLLDLARRDRIDLTRVSILRLADQYLAFVETLRAKRLELAADYLVMAAWLAYLKSRLLLPEPPADDEPPAEILAAALAQRLRRLEAMREAAAKLADRPRLGRDVHGRGAGEGLVVDRRRIWDASLFELLEAYASQRQKQLLAKVTVRRRPVLSLADAREILERLVGPLGEWAPLDRLLAGMILSDEMRSTILASSFAAALELAREGRVALRQDGAFAPLWVRRPEPAPPTEAVEPHG